MQNIKEHISKVGQKFSKHHWFRIFCRECFIIPKQLQYEKKCVGHWGPLCLYLEPSIWGGSSGWSGGWFLQLLHIRVPLLQLWAKQKHIWPLLWPTGLTTNSENLFDFLSKHSLICLGSKSVNPDAMIGFGPLKGVLSCHSTLSPKPYLLMLSRTEGIQRHCQMCHTRHWGGPRQPRLCILH